MTATIPVAAGSPTRPIPVLQAVGLGKDFGSITAVDDVSLDIHAGEILAIVGDNGAGKSTVVKLLSGALRPDRGHLELDGERISFRTPEQAREAGIETVYQDLALAPNRDVVSNLFLGREVCWGGVLSPFKVLNRREMRRQAEAQLATLEVSIPSLTSPIGTMSGGQRQSVAIARSIFWASRILFMDEPTAALGVRESRAVLRLARNAADRGVAVVIISHAMPHVVELADRAAVFRHGRKAADVSTDGLTADDLVDLILGIKRKGATTSIPQESTQ